MSESNSHNSKRSPILGCIADDVTGATDLAINLVQGGMCVVQLLGIPTSDELAALDADAVVVGLKTRSIPKDDAISQSLDCLRAFQDFGIQRYFFKYCSTFDSTTEGNIGPVAEALLGAVNANQTIFCPAFPTNGRTVYQGHLFVSDMLLNESGMEKHPLNPMTDANLVRFLASQCDQNVGLLGFAEIEGNTVAKRLKELEQESFAFVVTDACNDSHLKTIADSVADMPLVTGGSRIGRFLATTYRDSGILHSEPFIPQAPTTKGRSLIVSGSCSQATNQQVAWMKDKIPVWQLQVDQVIHDRPATLTQLTEWARDTDEHSPLMIYSTSTPDEVAEVQSKHGTFGAAEAIEEFLSSAAESLVQELGVTRLVVAGGETSGAVVKKLGVQALQIGPEICPGVPWTQSTGERLALALKSGNFGEEDFFETALGMLP